MTSRRTFTNQAARAAIGSRSPAFFDTLSQVGQTMKPPSSRFAGGLSNVVGTLTRLGIGRRGAVVAQDRGRETCVYLIDISYSMGGLEPPTADNCSRLTFALAQAAWHITENTQRDSSIVVMTFDSKAEVIMPLHRRGSIFDVAAFADKCNSEISRLRQGGSDFFSALLETVKQLQHSDNGVTTIVAITDGEATDPENFKRVHRFIRAPPDSFDMKLLMIKVDRDADEGCEGTRIRDLCNYNGHRLAHVLYIEAPLPSQMSMASSQVRESSRRINQAFVAIDQSPSSSRYRS